MANSDVPTRKQTEAQLIDRALKDPAFRAELVADPKAVFARELGLEVPGTVAVQVLQETPTTVYLVLPPRTVGATAELSDAELETVAGGWSAGTNDCAIDSCKPGGCDTVTKC